MTSIWIDCKNACLYAGGINKWLGSILNKLDGLNDFNFTILYPRGYEESIKHLPYAKISVPWPKLFPRLIQNFLYCQIFFPLMALRSKPEGIFLPYYDVRVPKNIKSIITIHDLCTVDLPDTYSYLRRLYHKTMLNHSVKNASKIVTVSKTSRSKIVSRLGVNEERVIIVPNILESDFLDWEPSCAEIAELKNFYGFRTKIILYTSGVEARKNLSRLISALNLVAERTTKFVLLITGNVTLDKQNSLLELCSGKFQIHFFGRVSENYLKLLYRVSDLVVCPSLDEGFGRSCLEALAAGTPLACSNIEVFRENFGNYAHFFDPREVNDMSSKIMEIIESSPRTSRIDSMYLPPYDFEDRIKLIFDSLKNINDN